MSSLRTRGEQKPPWPGDVYAPLPREEFERARDLSGHRNCRVQPLVMDDFSKVECLGYHCRFCGAGTNMYGHQDAGDCLRHYSTLVAEHGLEAL